MKIFPLFVLTCLAPLSASAAIISAPTCNQEDVQAAIDSAANGDTVLVPAGTCIWTKTVKVGSNDWDGRRNVYIGKHITLKGAGIDQTVILDNIPVDNTRAIMLQVYTAEEGLSRLTGFTFGTAEGNTGQSYGGKISLTGKSKSFRVDHNRFTFGGTDRSIYTTGWLYGVIDHNIFQQEGQSTTLHHQSWGGKAFGDGSYSSPLSLGSEEAIFLEDNQFLSRVVVDAFSGARYVVRHNHIESNGTPLHNHGTDSTGRARSSTSWEFYENTIKLTKSYTSAIHLRGGTGVIFNNKLEGSTVTWGGFLNYRSFQAFLPYGSCDGASPFDLNEGIVHDSGVHNGDSTTNGILTDTTKNWTADHWLGYSIVNFDSAPHDSGTHSGVSGGGDLVDASKNWAPDAWKGYYAWNIRTGIKSGISSNSGNTLRTANMWNNGDPYEIIRSWGHEIKSNANNSIASEHTSQGNYGPWKPGDRYKILRAKACLDQVGRSTDKIELSGSEYAPSPVGWPNQLLDPVYVWGNTMNGSSNNRIGSNQYVIRKGEEYFTDVPRPGYVSFTYPHPLTKMDEPPPNTPVSIVYQPQNQYAVVGKFATFTVYANGSSPITYQWKKNGVDIAGATNSTYKTTLLELSNSGEKFSCVIKNVINTGPTSVTTREATLTVTTKPIDPPPGDDEDGSPQGAPPPPGSVQFGLFKNFFNPTKSEVLSILLESTVTSDVEIKVINSAQQEVNALQGSVSDGSNTTIVWNGRNKAGSLVASGTYVLVLKYGGVVAKKKVVVVK